MPAESIKESVTMFLVLIPHKLAARRLEAQARISLPTEENRKNRLKKSTIKEQTPITHNTWGEILVPRIVTELIASPTK